ncbi:SDR family oxidoreductase [Conexibacter sp. SYSU D00693]|uniref:SDR family oxidoreductase n=1 Tax=Conexibacter sp. SYSU D00693 TaxID=2812560 RepID=UPI00196B83D5|nr:SDR family oxidoreductase [Conexibacter sp. SYSU D00693]
MAQRTILFTGFPGFIGARLIPKLLAGDPEAQVAALVEPRMVERARGAAARLDGGDRVRIVPGDITQPRLGLDDATYEQLRAETVTVHHLAAIYDLAVPMAIAERVNVLGTQHVLAFCRDCERLERHDYVSTAYVAGLRSGLVREDELAVGQAFKNHYESTKFAAEVLVRMSMDEVPTTIFRPAIVVGDSRTGETQKFDGPYYMLRTIAATRGPLMQLGNPEALFNVVPVDFVVDAMAAAAGDDRAVGLTLHLTDPEPVSSADIFRLLAQEYAGRTPSIKVPLSVLDGALRFSAVRALYGGTPRESLMYLNHPVRFDTTNAAEVLSRHGLHCPRFPEYVSSIVRFFAEHEDDDALRPAH